MQEVLAWFQLKLPVLEVASCEEFGPGSEGVAEGGATVEQGVLDYRQQDLTTLFELQNK